MALSHDDRLISRALAAGWKASVEERQIPVDGFSAVWVWSWQCPDEDAENEVFVSPRDGLRITINDRLRERFGSLDVKATADYDLEDALIGVLHSVEQDLRWIINSSSRERAYSAFSAAYKAIGSQIPDGLARKLRAPALESD